MTAQIFLWSNVKCHGLIICFLLLFRMESALVTPAAAHTRQLNANTIFVNEKKNRRTKIK